MVTPALDEQESNFTIEATDRKCLSVFSNDVVMQRRIERLGIVAHRSDGYGKFYTVDLNQFSFGIRRKRQMSDEQRQAISERFAALRAGDDDDDDDGDGDE